MQRIGRARAPAFQAKEAERDEHQAGSTVYHQGST